MIRILDRLVARSFLRVFLAFVLGAPILFILGDATEKLEGYLDLGVTWMDVVRAYSFMVPQYIQYSFPIAALVGAVFTVQTMTLHREIVAAKAGGISFHRLTVPILALGVFLTGIALALEQIVPRANKIAAEILQEPERRLDFRGNFVYQGENGRSLAVQSLNVTTATMSRVTMETVEPGTGQPRHHLWAPNADYDPMTGWTFRDGIYRWFLEDGEELAFNFRTFRTRGFSERPEDLLEDPPAPEEMTFQEMGRLADVMTRSGGSPTELLVDRQGKLAIPVATLVIVLFGAPLATSTKRGGTAYGIGVALLSVILYLLLFRIAGAIGDTGGLSPFTAAWLPNFIFLGAGFFFMVRVRT